MLTTGTLAWQQMTSKTIEFIGYGLGAVASNIVLHDDFAAGAGARDVYVENISGAEVFVRVKLNEAMNINSSTWRPSSGDWLAHTYGATAVDCGHANRDGQLFHDYFTWTMGGQKYYRPANGSQQVVQDTTVYAGNEPGVRLTPNAQICKASDYLAKSDAEKVSFSGWIYDTDGYAYWSQPVGPEEATGLLLHQVIVAPSLQNTAYYYAINVKAEAVDTADIPMWTQGSLSADGSGARYPMATEQGKAVINAIAALVTNTQVEMPAPVPGLNQPEMQPEAQPDAQPGGQSDNQTDTTVPETVYQ